MERMPAYNGGVESREETDKTNFANPEIQRSVEALKRQSVLIPASGKEFYHGRDGAEGEFKVSPFFDNSGNRTGNRNVNKIPALHVASKKTAERFAKERAGKGGKAEVHHIEILDPDATFFDMDIPDETSLAQSEETRREFKKMLKNPVMYTTLSFGDYKRLDHANFKELSRTAVSSGMIMDNSYIPRIAEKLNISEEGARDLIGAINVHNSVINSENPYRVMRNCIRAVASNKGNDEVNARNQYGKEFVMPVSKDYIFQWFRNSHIVGIKADVLSATLNMERLTDTYQIFDLSEAKSKEQLEERRTMRNQIFGASTFRIHQLLNRGRLQSKETPLKWLSIDQTVQPSQLIESAKRVSPRYKNIFESSSGTWEGFTLEQHTETALRIMNESFRGSEPRSVYDLGRLCLLCHDIGKPEAVANGHRSRQGEYNSREAERFLKTIDAPEELVKAVPHIVNEGMACASRVMLHNENDEAKQNLARVSGEIAKILFNTDRSDPNYNRHLSTIYNLCITLSVCDGASYSTYSTTRDPDDIRYHNSGGSDGQFDYTFVSSRFNSNHIRRAALHKKSPD